GKSGAMTFTVFEPASRSRTTQGTVSQRFWPSMKTSAFATDAPVGVLMSTVRPPFLGRKRNTAIASTTTSARPPRITPALLPPPVCTTGRGRIAVASSLREGGCAEGGDSAGAGGALGIGTAEGGAPVPG